jgi:hypothetical protein
MVRIPRTLLAVGLLAAAGFALKGWGGELAPSWRLYLQSIAVVLSSIVAFWRRWLVPVYVGAALLAVCLFEAFAPRPIAPAGSVATRMRVSGAEDYGRADATLGVRASIDDGVLHVVKTTVDGATIYDAHYTFAGGYRIGHRAPGRPVVWFLGCSLTFGEGVDDAASLPARFGELTNTDTYDFAFPGWGPHQALWLWQSGELAKRAPSPRLVVFGSFPGHARRCAGKAPMVRTTSSTPADRGSSDDIARTSRSRAFIGSRNGSAWRRPTRPPCCRRASARPTRTMAGCASAW